MHRFTSIARTRLAAGQAAVARPSLLGGVRFKIDQTSVGNDPDPALKKAHDEAISSHSKPEPFSEGHSVDRSYKDPRNKQDAHTEEHTKARSHREKGDHAPSDVDAINLAHGENTGTAARQRAAHATPEGSEFQPGQKGEQVGGHGTEKQGKQPGEGMGGQDSAPSNNTWTGMGQALKNAVGKGPANHFHTYARAQAKAVPESAVTKGARKPKDTKVKGAQTAHLPHHAEGQGDSLPAVKNNASLPSKQGKKETNQSPGSTSDRKAGTADTPGSKAVDPATGTHSPSFSPQAGPSAKYVHVVNSPEPDSHQAKYQYSTTSESGHLPSGTAPRSSTSTGEYPAHIGHLPKNPSGIGSSNKMIEDPLKGADEMAAQAEPGQAGDDAGGRGGRPYQPPPDVGTIPEDTLPKPVPESELPKRK